MADIVRRETKVTSVNTLTKFYTLPDRTVNVLKLECIDCISEIEVLQ